LPEEARDVEAQRYGPEDQLAEVEGEGGKRVDHLDKVIPGLALRVTDRDKRAS
jgi:hypothetical protein